MTKCKCDKCLNSRELSNSIVLCSYCKHVKPKSEITYEKRTLSTENMYINPICNDCKYKRQHYYDDLNE